MIDGRVDASQAQPTNRGAKIPAATDLRWARQTLSLGHAEQARVAPNQPISLPMVMDGKLAGGEIKDPQIAAFFHIDFPGAWLVSGLSKE
jgi:hypothetical protein